MPCSLLAGWLLSLLGVIETMPISMTMVDMKLAALPLIYVNNAFCEMTGYTAAQVLGRNCRLLQGEKLQTTDSRRLREAIRKGKDVIIRLGNYKRTGEFFENLLLLRGISDGRSSVRFMIGVQLPHPKSMPRHQLCRALAVARIIPEVYDGQKQEELLPTFTLKSLYVALQSSPVSTRMRRRLLPVTGHDSSKLLSVEEDIEEVMDEKFPTWDKHAERAAVVNLCSEAHTKLMWLVNSNPWFVEKILSHELVINLWHKARPIYTSTRLAASATCSTAAR